MTNASPSFVLNSENVKAALKKKGYKSFRQLAHAIGIHRNTIGDYFSGSARLIPEGLEKMLLELDLTPQDAITRMTLRRLTPGAAIATLIDELQQSSPDNAYVLFGSRARGKAKQFSDYDVGVFCQGGKPFSEFSKLLDLVAEWNEQSFLDVQLVNLCLADQGFLSEIRNDLLFLGGSMKSWVELLRYCGFTIYE